LPELQLVFVKPVAGLASVGLAGKAVKSPLGWMGKPVGLLFGGGEEAAGVAGGRVYPSHS
jgi:hypothetical protein